MAQLNNAIISGNARVNGNLYHNSGMVALGTCATAAATAAKVVTISDAAWTLKVGDIIAVKYTYTNTASSCTINVNSSGAKQVWYNTSVNTGTSSMIFGTANRYVYYIYDGTYWVWMRDGTEYNDNTYPASICTTAAATAAKTAAHSNYVALTKSYDLITIANSNTSATALTMNINGQGAKPIYINGTASSTSNYTLPAGTYLVYYDGTNYYFNTDGKIPNLATVASTGSYNDLSNKPTIPTVNNATLTIQKNGTNVQTFTANASSDVTANITVPTKVSELTNDSGYKTTDNNTTYSLTQDSTDGHKITLTPSSGTAQTITIPDNNTTYSVATQSADGLLSSTDKTKLDGIATGAEVNVQANWNTTDTTSDSYIQNKPTIPTVTSTYSSTGTDAVNGTAVASAIGGLDVSSVGGAGKYISAISETDGKISATSTTMDTTPTSASTNAITSGAVYTALSSKANTSDIPTVNNATLTIQKNGTNVQTFTANQSTAATANITVPTKVSELTNDSGFITSYTDTKNTAGSTDSSSKLFLIGATSQAASLQTYSDDQVYTTSGVLTANRMTPNNGLLLNAAASYTTSTNSWLRFITQTDNTKPWGCKIRIFTKGASGVDISQQIDASVISRNNTVILYGVDCTRNTWSGNSGIYQLRAISPKNDNNGYYGGLELWINSTTSRVITIYPLELENCTIESSLQTTAYNSTYHNSTTPSTCSNRMFGVGLQGSCDTSTNSYQLIVNYPYWKVTSTIAMSGYTLFGMKSDTTITPFSVYSSSQSSNTTNINTARVYNTTDGMDYTQGIMYSNSGTWWAKSATCTSGPTYSSSANDFRYTDNCLPTYNETNFGMQWRNRVYLRGVIKSDKLFYLRPYDAEPLVLKAYYNTSKACFYTTSTGTTVVPLSTAYTYYDINTSTYYKCTSTTSPGTFTAITDLSSQTKYQKAWTQSPADGTDSDGNQYVFWFVGYPYRNSSYEYGQYQINLAVRNPVYWFKDDVFQEYGTSSSGGSSGGSTVSFTQSLTSGTKVGTLVIDGTGTDLYCSTDTNTKNTAGSTDTSSKIFLIGATSQAANPQTYSQDTAYVDTNGHLYSNSKQVVNLSDSQALTNKTYNGYTLAAASAKGVITTVSKTTTSTDLPTGAAVATAISKLVESSDKSVTNVVSLTKAEYDALTTKSTDTLYNITDDIGLYNGDSIPTDGIVAYDGDEIPEGYEEVTDKTENPFLNYVYPVGSIYMSVNNVSPDTFLGGTWEQIKDTFLLSAGDTYSAGATGGSATTPHVAPYWGINSNNFQQVGNNYVNAVNTLMKTYLNTFTNAEVSSFGRPVSVQNVGGSIGDNSTVETEVSYLRYTTTNLPPYLAVYMWKRTA